MNRFLKIIRKNSNKEAFLKVLGIILFLFTSLFFVANQTLAWYMPMIEFPLINKSANDAKYMQWKIKAQRAYNIEVHMEDDEGNDFIIEFETKDEHDDEDYDASDNDRLVVRIDENYYDDTERIYESASFSDLMSLHLSKNSNVAYNCTGDVIIKKIIIYGNDFTLYSITLADNKSFNNPCWEKDASNWNNLGDFEDDDGKVPDAEHTFIQFNNSNIHVTKKYTEGSYRPIYPPNMNYGFYVSPSYIGSANAYYWPSQWSSFDFYYNNLYSYNSNNVGFANYYSEPYDYAWSYNYNVPLMYIWICQPH
ncbi:MAG: hypothetical protein AB1847_20540 [bacterium]